MAKDLKTKVPEQDAKWGSVTDGVNRDMKMTKFPEHHRAWPVTLITGTEKKIHKPSELMN